MVAALEAERRGGAAVGRAPGVVRPAARARRRPASGRSTAAARERLRARYLVGCDGARSAVRGATSDPVRRLAPSRSAGSSWTRCVDRPAGEVPHPHFVGDTSRPIVTLPMSPGRHRWEWMLHPGEDAAPFLEPPRIRELMAPWLDGEHGEIERAVVYTFHARTAARVGARAGCCSPVTPRT